MRAISIIYRRELGAYLRSPLGWVIAAVVLLIDGILFQSLAMVGEKLSARVLEQFFWGTSGLTIITAVVLSGRLIAEDRQNHSMILLNTSPVRDSEIVVAKFLSAVTFLAMMLALSIYMPLLIKVNGKVTGAQIFVGYLGLLLLGSAVVAIGLFASALTRNQLVAYVLAAAITVALLMLFQLASRLDEPLKGVLSQIDLWWIHYQNGFMRGVVNLRDVIYYVGVTYVFLLLAVKTLEAKRWQ
ncbi:MAG: ABC transporter permease subunit [Myxococcales bacterium]|nr:ABC transporter permease subunit [Myxococcales bacterium]